jgi:hypothetical protein
MVNAYAESGVTATWRVARIDETGARVEHVSPAPITMPATR